HKQAVRLTIGNAVTPSELNEIEREIDQAIVIGISPENLTSDVEKGILDPETAANAKLYPEGTTEKAQKAHAERLKMIQAAQAPRGVGDLQVVPNDEEKIDKIKADDTTGDLEKDKRGDGK